MKKMKKFFGMLLVAAFVLSSLPTLSTKAADENYTYTVRFYSGQQGTFGGQQVITFDNLSYGSVVNFNPGSVNLNNDSKYYVKGIRESGRDNNTVSASSFVVTGDRDYVVAYGLRGNMVAYTILYLDVDGNELAPADIYYGNVGDKPVVAFLYIEGYIPQAYNLTKTLVEDESENVFTFLYSPADGNISPETVTSITLPGTDRSVVEVIPGDLVRKSSRLDGGMNSGRLPGNGGDGDGNGAEGMEIDEPEVPLDLDFFEPDGVEIEDARVPLANQKFNIGPIEVDARMLMMAMIIAIAVGVIALSSWWYWKPRKKKKDDEENSYTDPV